MVNARVRNQAALAVTYHAPIALAGVKVDAFNITEDFHGSLNTSCFPPSSEVEKEEVGY